MNDEVEIPEGYIEVTNLDAAGRVFLGPDGDRVTEDALFKRAELIEDLQAPGRHTSWVDEDPKLLHEQILRRAENLNALRDWLMGALTEGTDYGAIKADGKPSLWQPGAEKVAALLNLTHEFPDNHLYVEAALKGSPLESVVIRCIVYRDGDAVGEGMGARETNETKGLNSRIKMAQKSAYIDAVKRAAGLSDYFTQDDPTEGTDDSPIGDSAEAKFLYAKAEELFPDKTPEEILESLALRRFQIPDGDWRQIPRTRVRDAVQSMTKTARVLVGSDE